MWLLTWHRDLAIASLAASLAVGLFGLWGAWRHGRVGRWLWGLLAAAELLFLAQMLLGAAMMVQGSVPARGWIHVVYGLVAVGVLPAAYVLTRREAGRREAVTYAVLGFFLAGLALRAMATGGSP